MAQIVLISGEEELLMERAAREEASSFLPDLVREYRGKDGVLSYEEEISCVPMDGASRAHIVWAPEVPRTPPGNDVLIVLSKKKIDYAHASRRLDFPKLKTYDDKNEVVAWVVKEGERYGLDLRRVASGLFVNSRKSLRKLASEIRKLSVLVPSGPVGPEEVRSVLPFSADLSPKEILEAVCEGHPVKALTYLDKLQDGADETGWVIAYLQNHVIRQLRAELLFSSGASSGDVAKALDIHPFIFRKTVEPMIGLWSPQSLKSSLEELCRLDLDHKRGVSSASIGLSAEILRLSEEAKKNAKRSRGN